MHGRFRVIGQDRNDLGHASGQIEPGGNESCHETLSILPQAGAQLGSGRTVDQLECGAGHGRDRRGKGRREDKGARTVDEDLDDGAGGGEIGAEPAEGLTQGAHVQVDLALTAEMLRCPASAGTQNAGAMSIIDHEQGIVLLLQSDQSGDWREIAVHAEDAVTDDEPASAPLG